MGRPPLPMGTFGKILFLSLLDGRVEARVRVRDLDGRVRLVGKRAPSRAAAERLLKSELAARHNPSGTGAIAPSTRVATLAALWLAAPHDWSTGTERTYGSVVRSQVEPVLGQLRVCEVTPGVVSRALATIAASGGPSAAKSAKACLSGMFGMAVEDGAAPANPVRGSTAKIGVSRRAPRALTEAETARLVALFRASARACELDLPDLVDWMLATGCRIGEALALRRGLNGDGRPLLNLDGGTWEVNATVVRVASNGLLLQQRTKTEAGWRVIAVPGFAVDMIRTRQSRSELMFPAPIAGRLRDPSNVSGDLRQLLDSFECDTCRGSGHQLDERGAFLLGEGGRRVRCDRGPWSWVTSHTFRKTVATRLDEAGFTPRQVADQLGHANPSMTLDVYFGRQVVSAAAAKVLDR